MNKPVESASPESTLVGSTPVDGALTQGTPEEEQFPGDGYQPPGFAQMQLPEWTGPGCWSHLAENQPPVYTDTDDYYGDHHPDAGTDAVSISASASLARQPMWSQPTAELNAADLWLLPPPPDASEESFTSMAPAHTLPPPSARALPPPPSFSRAQPDAPPSVAAQAFGSSFSMLTAAERPSPPPPLPPAAAPPRTPTPQPIDDDLRSIMAQLGITTDY